MTISIVLPFGSKDNVKNIVFSILTKEYPLKIIELTNYIKKRYGKSVTFQAVRKAVLELVANEILIRKENEFAINKEWVKKSKLFLEELNSTLEKEKVKPKSTDSIPEEVSVFTFDSLNSLMKFWQDLIDDWYKNFKKEDYRVNCYQAAHVWECLFHPEKEKTIMTQLKQKGIKSYTLSTGNTLLDKQIRKFYTKIGIKTKIEYSSSQFDKSYYVGTYGNLIVQTKYPQEIVKSLDLFFRKNKTLEDLDLTQLSDIVNKKITIKLTIIKNLSMAKQINKSIIEQFE